jgi:hypothetical protein
LGKGQQKKAEAESDKIFLFPFAFKTFSQLWQTAL